MKNNRNILLFLSVLLSFLGFNNSKAQTIQFSNCEGYNMNQFGPANVGSIGVGSTGTNIVPPLAFSYQSSPLASPAATPKSGLRVLQVNTNATAAGKSAVFYSGILNFTRNCVNSPMTVSFWMYRTGTDANADRIRVLVNTVAAIGGGALLTTINRSRALSPTEYGMDGWYRYEATIPPTFNSNGYLMLDAIDASAGASGNIFIDDIQYYDNGGAPGLVTGGVADAGPNITICTNGRTEIGCTTTPFTTYAWAPGGGLSSTTISNPIATPAATTNYTVTTTTTGAGCTTTNTDVVTVTVLASNAPAITSAASTTNCSGTALTFPFTASSGPTGYIWLAADNAITNGESYITTTNSGTLNDNITSASTQVVSYSVSAYNASCPAGTTPIQSFSVNVIIPTSGTAPSNVSVCPGGTAVFATTASGGGAYTYQWQQNGGNIGGATSASYSLFGATTPMNGNTYRCVISNGCTPSYTTATAVLTVLTMPTLVLTGTNPSCSGGFGTISATGTGISTYLWNTGQTFAVINVVAGAYTCTVTSAGGCSTSATYNLANPPVLGSFTSGATTICSGVAVNVTLNGTGGTPGYSYNWIAASNANVTGESTTTQNTSTINNTLVNTSAASQNVAYSYSVTDANGCVAVGTKTITVSNPVITTTAPPSVTVCETSTTSFTTAPSGGAAGFIYQWQVDNGGGFANAINGAIYSGATTPSLGIAGVLISMNTYSYKCIVTDVCSQTVQSGVAILNVTAAFTFTNGLVEQPILTNVGRCASKQEILRLKIDMTVGSCPSTPTVTNIVFTAGGTEAEVKKAYIYYSGSNPNFINTNLFATIPNVVGGSMSIAGSQTLGTGTNYFWIVYDINPTNVGAFVDATLSNFTFIGGSNPALVAISTGSPAGSRSISTCVAPGGISTGLTYWLKSDDGTNLNSSTHDAPINNWSSSFSNISDLTQPTSTKQPIFKDYTNDTTFNFNPYLSFDGSDDILQNIAIIDLLKDDGLAMLICAQSTTVAPNNRTSFGFQESAAGIAYQISPENRLRYQNSGGIAGSFNTAGFTTPDADFTMAKMVSIAGNSSGIPDIADFMRNDEIFQSSATTAPIVETGFTIGGSGDGGTYNRGNSKIAEVITYNTYLSSSDLDKVQTYAAIKYGIHLNKDYFSSAGNKIWDFAAEPTYNHDIAGIGRDDQSGLIQKQTQSVNIDEMLTIGLDSIEDKNKNNIAVFANDNSFLVWGNNDLKPFSDFSTLIPAAAPFLPIGIEGRIKRVWKLQGTNFGTSGTFKSGNPENNEQNGILATTTIEVGFDDYLLLNVTPSNNLRLLIDDDGVDFSNAIIKGPGKSSTGATASGSRIVFTDVEVGPGRNYITLATTDKSLTPLPIELVNFNGVCENNLVSITWNTASENNVRDFTIEQSIDGVNFTVAKTMTARGGNNIKANYNTVCNLIPSKINYFRLKETTNNNDVYYYNTISISGDCSNSKSSSQASISPNPVSKELGELTITFNKEITGNSDIKILNSLGNAILENEFKSNENYTSIKLQLKDLKTGIYFLEIKNSKGNNRFKFIVGD